MKKNKGFLLISSVFLTLFLGIILSVSLMRSELQLRAGDLRRASQDALYVAEAGIEQAVFRLRSDAGWRDGFNNVPLDWYDEEGNPQNIGSYTVQVADGQMLGNLPTVWLLSQGFVPHPQEPERRISRSIRAQVGVENPAAYFTSTVGDLILGSGADISGNILGRDVIFEVNSALPPAQRRINVDGNISYIRNIVGADNPFVDITGDIQQRPPLTFVSVDLARYRNLAQAGGRYIAGDFNYAGEINWENLGTANGLVFIEGNLTIQGNVTESIHFVSAGNIYISGDITTEEVEGVKTQVGLSAAEDVIIVEDAPANLEVDAFINAGGGLFKAEGDKFSKNEFNFTGAIAVRERQGERTSVDLNVYSRRNYTYDEILRDNLQIPFMSFIANIITWEEVGPDAVIPPPD